MKKLFRHTLILFSAALALALTGCGGGGGSDSPSTGPSGSSSFSGTSIAFNPTINFSAGDVLTYFNDESGSAFPSADPAINGTYSYVPNASFTAGTLTLTLDGVASPVVLEISNFRRNGANVTGFTARANGQSYPVTVTGTLPAYQPAPSGGGSGESRASDIPSSMQGTHTLTFHKSETAAISGVPADETETTFTIGARTLAFDGKTLSDPIFYAGNQLEWIFKDGSIWWAVSQAVGGGLNEINVQGPYTGSGNAFYGQYNDRPENGGGDGDGDNSVAGTYTGTFNVIPSGTGSPSGVPANGSTVTFVVSSNLSSLTFHGRTIAQESSSVTALVYSDASGSPTNNLTVTLRLDATTGAILSYEGMYFQIGTPIPNVAYFNSTSVTKQ